MYEIDPKFLSPDGSVSVEAAMEAGRKERAAVLGHGCRAVLEGVHRLRRSLVRRAGWKHSGARGGLPQTGTTA